MNTTQTQSAGSLHPVVRRRESAETTAERELCKRDVCMYCGSRAIGYKCIPDGPNEAGNWTHQYTATMRTEDRVLCVASAIFARENFQRRQQANVPDQQRECPHCHESLERYEDPKAVEIIGTLEAELADNERWMREVLTDFRIPFDDHKVGRRLAFTQWMFERQSSNDQAQARREGKL